MLCSYITRSVVSRPTTGSAAVAIRPRGVGTRPARAAAVFASKNEGAGESDAMSAPMDIQPEQQEAFYSDESLKKETPDLPSAAGEATQSSHQPQGEHHFDKVVYKVAHEASGSHGEGGRFDEEPFMPEEPYSPKPKERGHGVPPHKDASNTHAPNRE